MGFGQVIVPEKTNRLRLFELVYFRIGIVLGFLQLFLFCTSSVSSASSVVILPRSRADRRDASVRLLPWGFHHREHEEHSGKDGGSCWIFGWR